jgi:hypothetical protein
VHCVQSMWLLHLKLWYIYFGLLQLGLHAVAVVGKLVQKYQIDIYIQKEKQDTKQYKNAEYTQENINIQN